MPGAALVEGDRIAGPTGDVAVERLERLDDGLVPAATVRRSASGAARSSARTASQQVGVIRAGEPARIEAAVTDAGCRLVLIDGEPGVGKTRLLEHLVERAHAAGRTVLAGSATEFERLVPFGMYVDAFTRLSDGTPGADDLAEAALP
ncbi:ATP-binding protein [Nonomuraea basaltis]|uniref:ATP-binding protein n=1 Tax=Nonomuraea basaltis TaxID=2495887 RepID=UPI00110C44AD|nr:ATP-binding protein [Nonomuraea basaltis]TMR91118.1 hypothetical protein EJK15_51695 [Nonomuraea basaltis]